jgi:NADPH:quinone reductase-like Zn-dependent oxidoreductase
MKANVYHSYGSPDDVLELRDFDRLVGNDKEVLV